MQATIEAHILCVYEGIFHPDALSIGDIIINKHLSEYPFKTVA